MYFIPNMRNGMVWKREYRGAKTAHLHNTTLIISSRDSLSKATPAPPAKFAEPLLDPHAWHPWRTHTDSDIPWPSTLPPFGCWPAPSCAGLIQDRSTDCRSRRLPSKFGLIWHRCLESDAH